MLHGLRKRGGRLALFVAATCLLAACGGGGSSLQQPPPPLVVGLNGRVTRGTGPGLAGAHVKVYPVGAKDVTYQVDADRGGYYRIAGVSPGRYNLVVQDGSVGAARQGVTVAPGLKVVQDLAVQALGGIEGTARLADSSDASGISLLLFSGVFFTTTYPDGSFSLSGVPAGTYTLTAERSGYLPDRLAAVVVHPGQVTHPARDLLLNPRTGGAAIEMFSVSPQIGEAPVEATLSWRVWSQDSAPVPCSLQIEGEAPIDLNDCTETTSQNHTFTMAGRYDIALVLASGDSRTTTVVVSDPAPAVPPPIIEGFTAAPHQVAAGQSATLSWRVTGDEPISLRIDPNVGNVTGRTTVTVTPTRTTTYSLDATNAGGGTSAQVTVEVTAGEDCIPDPVLETAIRAALGLAQDPISCSALLSLEQLEVVGASDMEGLQYAEQLQELTWREGVAMDLSPLQHLAALRSLKVESSSLRALPPLAELVNLRELSLSGSKGLTDFSQLSELSGIEELDLDATGISDLGPLVDNEGLGSGDRVSLRDNPLNFCEVSDDLGDVLRLEARGVHVKADFRDACQGDED